MIVTAGEREKKRGWGSGGGLNCISNLLLLFRLKKSEPSIAKC